MDERIYFHQYCRPRANNPTYLSTNVMNSMTFFNTPLYQSKANHYLYESPPPKQRNNPGDYRYNSQPKTDPNPSKLSNIGQRSIQMDQVKIYDNQTSKFDIINNKPRQNNQQIKQYPWLSVQNRDDVYLKKNTNDRIQNPEYSRPSLPSSNMY